MTYFINANALNIPLAPESVQCVITSPPYWGLRNYGHVDQIGLEKLPDCLGWAIGNNCGACYVCTIRNVFCELWRVLKNDGLVWLNLGDTYVGATSQHKDGGSQGHNSVISKKTMGGIPSAGRRDRNKALYASGLLMKQLIGVPWRVALALQADGWYLRSDIIWSKTNPMPESVSDRPTKAHEYIFLLSKSKTYYYDAEAIKEPSVCSDSRMVDGFVPKSTNGKHSADDRQSTAQRRSRDTFKRNGSARPPELVPGQKNAHREDRDESDWDITTRNKRSVWTVSTQAYRGAHFATFPEKLVDPMVLAGSRPGDLVLDPFSGSGTVGKVCVKYNRRFVGLEINPQYIELAQKRVSGVQVALV